MAAKCIMLGFMAFQYDCALMCSRRLNSVYIQDYFLGALCLLKQITIQNIKAYNNERSLLEKFLKQF